MLDRLLSLTRNRVAQRAADGLVVAALLVGSVADAVVPAEANGWGGARPLELLAAVAISVPLLWRTTKSVMVLAIVFAGGLTDAALVAPAQAGFAPFVAIVFAYYSLGAHAGERRSVLAFTGAVVAGLVSSVVLHEQAGNVIPGLVWTAAAWIVGRIIRSWRARAAELESANRALEEQREMQAHAAVVVERGRIARELHDVIAHNVSMIVVQAGAASRVLEGEQQDVRQALEAIETTGRATVDEMRRLLGILRRDDDGLALSPQPGLSDLDELVASVREAGLSVELRVEGAPTSLPPALDLTAYRIAQEALTNALKHAGTARAQLTVRYEPSSVEIELRDDGAGSGNGTGSGHGLIGMRERAALWGGRLDAGRTDAGWVVCARLPLRGAT